MNRRLLLTSLLLAGCASAPMPEDYAAEQPALRLESYFNGPLTAHGLFTDRAGKVKRRFVVQLVGRWQGGVGTLEEDFTYSDGKTERRVWTITALGDLCVYCAGYYRPMTANSFDLADARRHLDVNLVGALNLLDALLPRLLAAGRGHLSLVSSVAGYRGLPKALAYGPSKAALTHLAEALYLDLQPRGDDPHRPARRRADRAATCASTPPASSSPTATTGTRPRSCTRSCRSSAR